MGTAPPGETYNASGDGLPMIAGAGDYGDRYPEPKKWTSHPMAVAQKGDLLICVRATIGDLNWADREYCLGRGVAGIRAINGHADLHYLAHYLDAAKHLLAEKGSGSTFPAIRRADLTDFPIPIPFPDDPRRSLAEQKRIAAILDKADAIRRRRQEAARLADTLRYSAFAEMFGDPLKNPHNWPEREVGSVILETRGGANLAPFDFVSEGFPILHKGAVKPNGVISLDAKKDTFARAEFAEDNTQCQVDRSFIAVTLRDLVPSGPTIGLAVDLRTGPFDKYLLAQGAYGLRLNTHEVTPEYFVQLSNMPSFRTRILKYVVGSTQIHVRMPVYLGIPMPIPPIKLQVAFGKFIRETERVRSNGEALASDMDTMFKALVQRAFRGEL